MTSGTVRLWAFDFDGTLAPIVADRGAARLDPACRALLRDLAASPLRVVGVISSRALGDLVARVDVPGLYLGGGSGLEWRTPGGHRIRPGEGAARSLERARRDLLPVLRGAARLPGVAVEDKEWSMAIHYRGAGPAAREILFPRLEALSRNRGIRVLRGPEVAEIPFFPQIDKSFGLRRLCRLAGVVPVPGLVAYAGDDESDAAALRWVLERGGVAIAAAERAAVPGARVVAGPEELEGVVREIAGLPAARRKGGDRRSAR